MRIPHLAAALTLAVPALVTTQTPLPAGSLKFDAPARIAEIDTDRVKGQPSRLAWSPDGTQLYLQMMDGQFGKPQEAKVTHHLFNAGTGKKQDVASEPEWVSPYWTAKSGQAAPGSQSFKIDLKSEVRAQKTVSAPMGGDLARGGGAGGDGGSTSADHAVSAVYNQQAVPVNTMFLHGEVVGEFVNSVIVPGLTFGWGPAGSGVIAYSASKSGRVTVMDDEGKRRNYPIRRTRCCRPGRPTAAGSRGCRRTAGKGTSCRWQVSPARRVVPRRPVRRTTLPAGFAACLLLATAPHIAARQTPAGQQPPTFKSGVQLVEVDVRVFDRNGRFVTDLTREDFELVEEGMPQAIEAMLLVGETPPSAEQPGSILPARPDPAAEPRGRQTWVFMFDLNHLTPGGGFDRARKAVEDFVSDRFRDGDVAGILAGDTMVNNRLTSVREELLGAVKQVKPRSDARTRFIELTREWPRLLNEEEALRIARGEREPLQRATTRACSDDPEQCQIADSAVRQKGLRMGGDIHQASMATLAAMNGLASGLARMPGPKTIVFLSDGFVAQEIEATVRSVAGQIARAGARVYAIDVRGLDRAGQSNLLTQEQVENPAGPATKFDGLADGSNSVAVDTGGLMIRNENNIGRALDRVADDSGRYYVLAYQPSNANFDGKYRAIRVRVKREGLRVRARSGYLALPPSRMLLPTPVKPPEPATSPAVPETPLVGGPPLPTTGSSASDPAGLPVSAGTAATPREPPSASADPAPLPAGGAAAPAVRLRPDGEARIRELSSREASNTDDAARRGWDAYQRGDIEAAADAFLKAAGQPGASHWVSYALGMTQAGLGRVDEAIASWERVRAAVPDFEPVYMDLADTYAAKSDLTSALAVVREAEKRWPASADVQSAIGVIHVRRGAIDDGITALVKATSLTPDDPLAFLNLGRAYALRYHRSRRYVTSQRRWIAPEGDRVKAIEALRKCVELGGPYATAASAELSVLEWSK